MIEDKAITAMGTMKQAVITGISGQDGACLAKLLLNQGYNVCGISRDAQISPFINLQKLGIRDHVHLESVALNDFRSVIQVLFKIQPDEIYHLAGQSSVPLSFAQPVETQERNITLGNIEIQRDWGWAPEYVEAMHLMLQKESPDDFVIATGESRKLADFADVSLAHVGLDPKDHLVLNDALLRPTEIMTGRGNPGKAATKLGWKPRFRMEDVARMMVEACQAEAI